MLIVFGRPHAIDAHDLLFRGVDAAGQNTGLHRRLIAGRTQHALAVDALQPRQQPLSRFVLPHHADESGASAERRHVVRRIAGAAGDNFGRVVLQNQDRRFARYSRHAAINELVGNEIAGNCDASGRKRVHELQQPRLALAFTGKWMDRPRYLHRPWLEFFCS